MADKKKMVWDNQSKTGKIYHKDGSKDYLHESILNGDIVVDKADGSQTRTYQNLLGEYVTYETKKSRDDENRKNQEYLDRIAKESEEYRKNMNQVKDISYKLLHHEKMVNEEELYKIDSANIKSENVWKFIYFASQILKENKVEAKFINKNESGWILNKDFETDENDYYEREDSDYVILTSFGTIRSGEERVSYSKNGYRPSYSSKNWKTEDLSKYANKYIKLIDNLFITLYNKDISHQFNKISESELNEMYDWDNVRIEQEKQTKELDEYYKIKENVNEYIKCKVKFSDREKKILKILLLITMILSILTIVFNIYKLNRARSEFVEKRYNEYKKDDLWNKVEEFQNYENFEDFWKHEKDDRALKKYIMYKNGYGYLYNSFDYECLYKFTWFRGNSYPFLTLFYIVFYIGIFSMITIVPFIIIFVIEKRKANKIYKKELEKYS